MAEKNTFLTITIIALIILGIAALAIGGAYLYYTYIELDEIILDNVYVAGVDVGGMSQRDAITAVEKATADTYSKIPMVVKVFDSEAQIPAEFVGTFHARWAVRDAYKFGHSWFSSKREADQQIAATTGYRVDITNYLSVNEVAIRDTLSAFCADYLRSYLTQSTYAVVGESPNLTLKIQLGTPSYRINLDELYDLILESYSNNTFETTGEFTVTEPDPLDLDAICQQHYVAPVNAYYNKEEKAITPGVPGYSFDKDALKAALSNAEYGTSIEIPLTEIQPEITAEMVESTLYEDVLGTYTAVNKSSKNRDTNLQVACASINGIVLHPGDVFSYNETLGERTTEKGYKPGASYSDGLTVMTIGGGICQVSSTLYYCVLQSELEVLTRQNHGFVSSYIPIGLDATVSWGTLDFRFKNNSDYPVKIVASSDGGAVTVSLMGTEVRDYTVEYKSQTYAVIPYETTYRVLPPDNPEGYKDGQCIVEPHKGYKVKTYINKYDANGNLISQEFSHESSYRKRDEVICKIEVAPPETTPAVVPETVPENIVVAQ